MEFIFSINTLKFEIELAYRYLYDAPVIGADVLNASRYVLSDIFGLL